MTDLREKIEQICYQVDNWSQNGEGDGGLSPEAATDAIMSLIGWRDMGDAPKKGEFLARRKCDGRVFQGFLQGMGNPNAVTDGVHGRWYECDAWMPLPPPPSK